MTPRSGTARLKTKKVTIYEGRDLTSGSRGYGLVILKLLICLLEFSKVVTMLSEMISSVLAGGKISIWLK